MPPYINQLTHCSPRLCEASSCFQCLSSSLDISESFTEDSRCENAKIGRCTFPRRIIAAVNDIIHVNIARRRLRVAQFNPPARRCNINRRNYAVICYREIRYAVTRYFAQPCAFRRREYRYQAEFLCKISNNLGHEIFKEDPCHFCTQFVSERAAALGLFSFPSQGC